MFLGTIKVLFRLVNKEEYQFHWTSCMLLRRAIILLPINKTVKLLTAQQHITTDIGMAVPLLKILTKAVETAPIPSCIAPINAEAVPAFFVKGAKQSADEFGNANPCVLKKTQIKKIVEYKPRK